MSYDFGEIPLNDIVKLGQRSLLYRDMFCVSWLLGRYCNYNCSYCWTHGRSDVKDHRSTALCLNTIDEIKKQARERSYNSFHFSFSGGEPTLHPGYLEILRHYAEDDESNYQSMHMTTNMSPGLKWLAKYADATRMANLVSITASWHKEPLPGKDNDAISFAEKLLFCQSENIQVNINMVMVPENFDELMVEAEYFQSQGINVTLKPQSNSNATKVVDTYTKDQLKLLHIGLPQQDFVRIHAKEGTQRHKPKISMMRMSEMNGDDLGVPQILGIELEDSTGKKWYMDQSERFNAFDFNCFKGWLCDSGFRSIIIREPCGSIKRSYSCQDKPLGNIETGFTLFDSPKECISPSCVSSADSKIPKWKKL